MTVPSTDTDPDTNTDGRHDFDFLFGRWSIANRMLTARDEWIEFPAEGEARPILGGLGNTDTYSAVLPDGRRIEGYTLRLFTPGEGQWRIWWASNTNPGVLDEPVVGRFTAGHGRFECDDVVGGQPVRVRYDWTPGTDTARWQQSYSRDGGGSWQPNWVMDFRRQPG